MNYAIAKRNGKPQLVEYEYHWAGDKFSYRFGTSERTFVDHGDLSFEILADVTYESKYVGDWLKPYEYPENNTLTVEFKDKEKMNLDDIWKLKGFKSFFGHKNIKKIVEATF